MQRELQLLCILLYTRYATTAAAAMRSTINTAKKNEQENEKIPTDSFYPVNPSDAPRILGHTALLCAQLVPLLNMCSGARSRGNASSSAWVCSACTVEQRAGPSQPAVIIVFVCSNDPGLHQFCPKNHELQDTFLWKYSSLSKVRPGVAIQVLLLTVAKNVNQVTATKKQPSRERPSSASNSLPCPALQTDAHRRSSHAFLCLSNFRGNSGLTPWDATNTITPGGSSSNRRAIRRSWPAACPASSKPDRKVWTPVEPRVAAAHASCMVGHLGPSSSAHTCPGKNGYDIYIR